MQKQILVAVDGTPCSENAACIAFAMARRMGASVVLTSVVVSRGSNSNDWSRKYFQEAKEQTRQLLLKWAQVGESGWEIAVDTKLLEGEHIAEEIVKFAEAEDFDFLVIGTHGRTGVDYTLLGSVAERVARRSSIPVMIARRSDTDSRWQLGIEEVKDAKPGTTKKGESHV